MELIRNSLSSIFCSKSDNSDERPSFFVQNGSKLLEELVAQQDVCSRISLRNFSSKELSQATDNFGFPVNEYSDCTIYRGSFEKRQILVKKYDGHGGMEQHVESSAVRDIIITSRMSFHKNVLKLIGYCLDYKYPTLVYQSSETCINLADNLLNTKLTWENKLSISLDIANVLAYLHTGFQTPIIHRNLKPVNVVIDKYVTAKLMDFSLCISIPRGEFQVEDVVMGTWGYSDPEYVATGVLTEKSDVYNFGVVLTELLTKKKKNQDFLRTNENPDPLLNSLRSYIETEEVEVIVNGDRMTKGETKQIQAFARLALKCIGDDRESRPDMVEVAKELRRIQNHLSTS